MQNGNSFAGLGLGWSATEPARDRIGSDVQQKKLFGAAEFPFPEVMRAHVSPPTAMDIISELRTHGSQADDAHVSLNSNGNGSRTGRSTENATVDVRCYLI